MDIGLSKLRGFHHEEDSIDVSQVQTEKRGEVSPVVEILHDRIELKNEKGEVVCIMDREIEAQKISDKRINRTGRRLKKVTLQHPTTGEKIDILALANSHNTEILMSETHSMNYGFEQKANVAFVAPIQTVIDLAVLLHELGHVDQFHDKTLEEVTQRANPGPINRDPDLPGIEEVVKAREAFPFMREAIGDDVMSELEEIQRLNERRFSLITHAAKLEAIRNQAIKERRAREEGACATIRGQLRTLFGRYWRKLEHFEEMKGELDREKEEQIRAEREKILVTFQKALACSEFTWENVRALEEFAYTSGPPEHPLVFSEVQVNKITVSLESIIGQPASLVMEDEFDVECLNMDIPILEKWRSIELDSEAKAAPYIAEGTQVRHEWSQRREALKAHSPILVQVENVFVQFLERDATRRALLWIKEIYERIGVDLLQPMLIEKKVLISAYNPCTDSIQRDVVEGDPESELTVSDVRTDLGNALWSYLATTKIMQRQYGNSLTVPGGEAVDLP